MSETLYVATTNRHKLAEIEGLLGPIGVRVRPCGELGGVDVREDGATFLSNARRKLRAYLPMTAEWILADDSGLEVPALGGRPGVRSARYAGVAGGGPRADRANNEKLLRELSGLRGEDRRARFVCAVALAHAGREVVAVRGTVEGRILEAPRGAGGFGYDPLFYYPPARTTFAEMGTEAKNGVSHRGAALRAAAACLRSRLRGRRRLAEIAARRAGSS